MKAAGQVRNDVWITPYYLTKKEQITNVAPPSMLLQIPLTD